LLVYGVWVAKDSKGAAKPMDAEGTNISEIETNGTSLPESQEMCRAGNYIREK